MQMEIADSTGPTRTFLHFWRLWAPLVPRSRCARQKLREVPFNGFLERQMHVMYVEQSSIAGWHSRRKVQFQSLGLAHQNRSRGALSPASAVAHTVETAAQGGEQTRMSRQQIH